MTVIPGVDPDLSAMMHDVFADRPATGDGCADLDAGLWSELQRLGLTRLTGSEAGGGSGAGWREAAELLSAAASTAIRLPLAEHDLLAGSLLEQAGLQNDDRLRTVAVLNETGSARAVPWALTAQRLTVLWPTGDRWSLADVDVDAVYIEPGANLIGEPRDTVRLDLAALAGTEVDPTAVCHYLRTGALARAVQICAAMDRALALTIEHTTARVQFGRALARFQAVQHLIADIAAECALARAATEAAVCSAVRSGLTGDEAAFRVAVARSCAGHAASVVVRNAHQALGAIGTTREYPLHRYTRAAIAWRGEFGSTQQWDQRVAEAAALAGPDGLWELITE